MNEKIPLTVLAIFANMIMIDALAVHTFHYTLRTQELAVALIWDYYPWSHDSDKL